MGRAGKYTVTFDKPVYICNHYTCAGKKEGEGPLGTCFDVVMPDERWGEDSFEKCERKMFSTCIGGCAQKAGVSVNDIDVLLGGDLLNQNISASFAALDYRCSYLGLYGACSTMAETLAVGSALIEAGQAQSVICTTGSHYCTAERQYRFPLGMGTQRPPSAQWTVTAAAATMLCSNGKGARITSATIGKVIDMGISDANNMGAAMAPAAADTICNHLTATNTAMQDYDYIITGDLGALGARLATELLNRSGISVNITDCGCLIYSPQQDTHMGGSGCGCGASVLNGYFLPMLERRKIKRILFVATGALLSTTSTMQGENIPAIAHAICIEV